MPKNDIRQFIDNAPWREAVTYRDTWPHEYVVRDQVDDDMFEAVVKYVREHGVEEPFIINGIYTGMTEGIHTGLWVRQSQRQLYSIIVPVKTPTKVV